METYRLDLSIAAVVEVAKGQRVGGDEEEGVGLLGHLDG